MTTAVLLCCDGLGGVADVRVHGALHVESGLCDHPEKIRGLAGATALVLGLCHRPRGLCALQREVRRLGLDPLGVEFVDLTEAAAGGPDRLEPMLAAAIARAEAFDGSRPEHSKIVFPTQVSRRALFTFSLPEYETVPAIDAGRCAAHGGCRLCVDVCPRGAITLVGGRAVHDSAACEPCGQCITACPTGAIESPAVTGAQVEAELRALLDPTVGTSRPRGIVYRCRRADMPETAVDWYPVTVPCTGMLTAGWMLAPLVLGAGSVAVRACGDCGCPLGNDALVADRMGWCREFLAAAGDLSARLVQDPAAGGPCDPLMPVGAIAPADPFGPRGTAAVVLALAAAAGGVDLRLPGPGSPLGLIDIDPSTCTGSGTCAESCPCGAIAVTDEGAQRILSFDAARCVGCGVCVGRCPEAERGAIRLRAETDVARLRAGRTRVFEGELAMCRVCGGAVAPTATLARISALIDDEALLAAVSSVCLDCRGVPAGV